MRKKKLEMVLSSLVANPCPKAHLEQYPTPAGIAAELLMLAGSMGDIGGRSILDPGCGNGTFLIGAILLGAERAVGVDIDPDALDAARRNVGMISSSDLGSIWDKVVLKEGDVKDVGDLGHFDTVLMNPPFGSQSKGADRPFLDLALSLGDVIYSLHNAKGIGFVKAYINDAGFSIEDELEYRFPLKSTFSFHTSEETDIPVIAFRSVRKGKTPAT